MKAASTFLERPLWLAVAFMLAVRVVLATGYGVHFEISDRLWQLLDAEVLRTDALRSLYFLHAQPPLFNALYAAALKLPGAAGPIFLQVLYLLSTLVMMAIVHFFLRRFGYGARTAAAGAAAFSVLPQVLLYENMFQYAHLEATLVLCATFFAATYLSAPRLGSFAGFAVCLVALALLRSLFHLVWIAFTLLAIWYLGRSRPVRALPSFLVALAAIAAVTSLYIKNFHEFGVFSPSSWQGLNTASVSLPLRAGDVDAFPVVANDFRARLERGEFSASAGLAFAASNFWAGWVPAAAGCAAGAPAAPALCEIRKANGQENYNNVAIIHYSAELNADAVKGLRLYPAFYLRRVASSFMTFFGTPSWSYAEPGPALKAYGHAWDRLLLFHPGRAFAPGRGQESGLMLLVGRFLSASLPLCVLVLVGILFVVGKGLREGIDRLRGREVPADWIFPLLVVALFVLLPNFINAGEADRIRYTIEPVLLLALARGAGLLLDRRRRSGGST